MNNDEKTNEAPVSSEESIESHHGDSANDDADKDEKVDGNDVVPGEEIHVVFSFKEGIDSKSDHAKAEESKKEAKDVDEVLNDFLGTSSQVGFLKLRKLL